MGFGAYRYLLELIEGLTAGKYPREDMVRNQTDDTILINKRIP